MKTLECLMLWIVACILPGTSIQAQCASGTTPNTITYDTTVVGVGRAPYDFVFPKFDPSLGTLTEVRLQSVVSIRYEFALENLEYTAKMVRHRLNRFDDVTSAVLSTPINNEYISPWYGYYPVGANDNVPGSGPDVVKVGPLNMLTADTLINRSYYNTAAYLGPGTVAFTYSTDAENTLTGATGYDGAIQDVVKFNITYVYCSSNILASGTIDLGAQNAGPMSALLKWKTTNESKAKAYEVMVSADGIDFTNAAIVPASGVYSNDIGRYTFRYDLPVPAKKLYFRVKQITKDGRTALSPIRPVTWFMKDSEVQIIPDPSGSYINVQLPAGGGGSWVVDLYGVNGQLIQKNNLAGAVSEMLPVKQKLQKGIYVIRASNTFTKELITKKVFIQ